MEQARHLLFGLRATGKPITMVALGGSITCGADTRRLEQQWTYLVFMWINATFPHANHTYLNRCRPATPSMMIGACLEVYLPHDLAVDLVLLEVSTCETSSNHKTQLCYSLFRKLPPSCDIFTKVCQNVTVHGQ